MVIFNDILVLNFWHNFFQEWDTWKYIGWVGNICFFSRFIVQWSATEKKRQVVIPVAFWWLSIFGSSILLSYSIHKGDSVFIAGQAFSWIPYARNLYFHFKNKNDQICCSKCQIHNSSTNKFCCNCGQQIGVNV